MIAISPTIIVVAFSRPQALRRSLRALNNAYYRQPVNLIISIDGGASEEVVSVAKEFDFECGEKKVVEYKENMGLRRHILRCGDLSKTKGSIILLEDDIVVDKFFYVFAQDALSFYHNDEEIAGVSLYSPEYNEYAGLPFSPLRSQYDTYFMQVPCSWGQAWTSAQWSAFRSWQEGVDDLDVKNSVKLPAYVKKWKGSSWKKYFALYLAECNKKFVYPYLSHATNVSDAGGFHNVSGSNIVQVGLPLQNRDFRKYSFSPIHENSIEYDSFMENCTESVLRLIKEHNGLQGSLCFDVYGQKGKELISEYDYCVTIKKANSQICRYKADYRPIENNIIFSSTTDRRGFELALVETCSLKFDFPWYSINLLLYWSGFNYLARKFAVANAVGLFKKVMYKL